MAHAARQEFGFKHASVLWESGNSLHPPHLMVWHAPLRRPATAGWAAYFVGSLGSSRVPRPGPRLAAGGHGQRGPLHLPPKGPGLLGHAQLGPQQAVAGPGLQQQGPRVQGHPAEGREHGWHAVGHGGSLLLLPLLLMLLLVVLLLLLLGVALLEQAGRREDDGAVAAC